MRIEILAFLFGILSLTLFNITPTYLIIFLTALSSLLIFKNFPRCKWLAIILFGFTWVSWYTHHISAWTLPSESEGKPIVVQGYIASIPEKKLHGTSFLFSLTQVASQPAHALIKLSASMPDLQAGSKWQFTVRLKRIHSLMNPGGFDYEEWAFQNGIRANGTVVNHAQHQLLNLHSSHFFLTHLRQKLKEKISANLPPTSTSPWISALALGERDNIAPEKWQVLRNTGTNHLMAIAGLHIGFLASFIYFLASQLWRRSTTLMLKMPAQYAGAIAALVIALIYSALAGFSIPTQRACLMISIGLTLLLMRRKILSWHAWSVAMLGVLLINPLSVLTESFWLSFGSVAFIIYGVSGRLQTKNLWWKVGRLQWVVSLGLIPLGIWLFQQCSLVSFIANSIAIPCVGFIIVPLTLLGCFFLLFSAKLGAMILILADKVLALLWYVLAYLAHLSWATWYQTIPVTWILLAGCAGVILFLLPSGMPGRALSIIWLLPLLLYRPAHPANGEIFFTLLDVGQGLSSVVQTQHHLLVFDTGAKLSDEYDMGDSVVVPFLHALHADKIDMMIISHGDNDHIGGAPTVLKNFPVTEIKTSVPEKMTPFAATHCLQGQSWDWDGVHFEFLYPTLTTLDLDNDSSCVLKVTNAFHQSILLTGDIEKFAEKLLLQTEKNNLSATILVAPHHGSKTSALNDFIDNVHPKIVLFPVGYRNRFHFPHEEVIDKYQQRGVQMYASDKSGALEFDLNHRGISLQPYRIAHQHRFIL